VTLFEAPQHAAAFGWENRHRRDSRPLEMKLVPGVFAKERRLAFFKGRNISVLALESGNGKQGIVGFALAAVLSFAACAGQASRRSFRRGP
jgi:hypothetical protein